MVTLDVFQPERAEALVTAVRSNIEDIVVTLDVFQLASAEISDSDRAPWNILFIFVTLDVSQFERPETLVMAVP